MSEILAEVFVPGRPRPKGSMRCTGRNHHMVEDNDDSKPWRKLMAQALTVDRDRRVEPGVPRSPWGGDVDVSIVAFFPADGPTPGDVDKLARNVLDALQDAAGGSPAVLANDSQVVGLLSERADVADPALQGIWVHVSTVDAAELRRRWLLRVGALEHFRAMFGLGGETGF